MNPDAGDTGADGSNTHYEPLAARTTIPPSKTTSAPELPAEFGRYRIVRCLGQGAMGSVYLADDTQLDRQVALKIPKFDPSDSELIERFYREARSAAMLRHANMCPVYDAGQIDGKHYLSMAYIEGEPLSAALSEDGALAESDAVTVILKLARALDVAHRRGVIHRDLKPANIMVDPSGEPVIMDFGLARRVHHDDSRLTQSGLVMGSPTYMSPEQVEGDAARMGASCDIYGLGVIFYELLTGRVPFQGSIAAVMGQIMTVEPKPPSSWQKGISGEVEAICLKMLAKRPEDRFASMADVMAALEAVQEGRPTGVPAPRVAPARDVFVKEPLAHTRGIVLQPWMLWAFFGFVAIGFGVIFKLISITIGEQQAKIEHITLTPTASRGLRDDTAHLRIDGKDLTTKQLAEGIKLDAESAAKVEIVQEGVVKPLDVGTARFLKLDRERESLISDPQRLVAEWVLSMGGKIDVGRGATDKLDASVDKAIKLTAIDLSGTSLTKIPPFEMELLPQIGSLKELRAPKAGLPADQLDALHQALPECEIR